MFSFCLKCLASFIVLFNSSCWSLASLLVLLSSSCCSLAPFVVLFDFSYYCLALLILLFNSSCCWLVLLLCCRVLFNVVWLFLLCCSIPLIIGCLLLLLISSSKLNYLSNLAPILCVIWFLLHWYSTPLVVVQLLLLLFNSFCCCLSIWNFPPFNLCRFGNEQLRSTIELFFQVWLSHYFCIIIIIILLDVNVYPSIYFRETFFYVPFFFFIKLGNILTLKNMFVIL